MGINKAEKVKIIVSFKVKNQEDQFLIQLRNV